MNAPLPPFRYIPWPERDIAVEHRDDGSIVMRSRVPLKPYPEHVPSLLRRWGTEAPERTWLAQRRGPGRAWRRVSYGEALATVDAVSQALIDLGLGSLRADSRCRPAAPSGRSGHSASTRGGRSSIRRCRQFGP
jgi:hypothetical protein